MVESFIKEQRNKYPAMQLQDWMKLLHQSAFGCEHLVSDPLGGVERIREEAPATPYWVEPLAGEYCRLHLGTGLAPETVGRLFALSARPEPQGAERLEELLAMLPLSKEEEAAVAAWRAEGFPPCRHSKEYREAYRPAYRVIRKEYAGLLPLLQRMEEKQGGILAIEGGSASGKSSLAELLQELYGCSVFHMDDFFLRPEQRTPERFAEPGGNVDRERVEQEILSPLRRGETVCYRPFDCSVWGLGEPVTVTPASWSVVEGAYSMHPALADYYDLSVYLEITEEKQRERIRKRNSPGLAARFFREWIPMEQRYFKELQVAERCDLKLNY